MSYRGGRRVANVSNDGAGHNVRVVRYVESILGVVTGLRFVTFLAC